MKETPLAKVKRIYGSKEALVDAILASGLAKESDEDSGSLKQRLLKASNKKLLRLSDTVKKVTDSYGSKERLVEALSSARNKAKDSDFVNKLQALSLTRLLDMTRMGQRN